MGTARRAAVLLVASDRRSDSAMDALTPVGATDSGRNGQKIRRRLPKVGEISVKFRGDFPFKINGVTF